MTEKEKFQGQGSRIASSVLVTAGVFCVVAIIYSVYHYGWTGQRRFTSWFGPVIYYVLPGGLAALSFFSLRLKPGYRIALATCWVLFVVSALGIELFLRLSNPDLVNPLQPITSLRAKERVSAAVELTKRFGVAIDTRDRMEVIADLRKQGTGAVPQIIVPPLEGENDSDFQSHIIPLGGIANTLTVVCNQNGQYLTYRSDQHGFHNPPGIWQSDRIDIAAVGNSSTLGYCVPSDRNFTARIRERYPATINLGMTGQGPVHVLGVLKEYAAPLKPRTVLWFYSEGSSLPELRTGKQSHTLLRYLERDFSQGLIERQSDVAHSAGLHIARQTAAEESAMAGGQDGGSSSVAHELAGFFKLDALRLRLGMVYGAAASEKLETLPQSELSELQADMNLLSDIFSEAKARVRAWDGQLYFVYIPSPGRYFGNPGVGVAKRAETLRLVSMLDIPIIDIYPAFQAHRDPLSLFPFRRPGHANEEGHRLIAETVLGVLAGIDEGTVGRQKTSP